MKRRTLLKAAMGAAPLLGLSRAFGSGMFNNLGYGESIINGPFKPTWDSLAQYQTPDWFRDAKFGIWAHWGPQCQPEAGDWYARRMYVEGDRTYKFHVNKYGHPSKFGFKDVVNEWKAEKWNPGQLLDLYKKAGAEYFFALANHHDNLDLYNSRYQSWNSTKFGPKKDLIGGWAKAAKDHGMRFGVSVHAAHAWTFYETAQHADKTGPYAGIPYDGKINKADGKGKWWDGADPQELYAQNHALSAGDGSHVYLPDGQWDWINGASKPSKAYCEKFFNRTIDLINKYDPDLIYFDDTALPLWPADDAGLRIAAHFYNKSIKQHGKLQSVLFGKVLNEQQRKCMVWDIERGQSNVVEPLPWQTDTCLGDWHYDRGIYDRHGYKSAKTVIQTLADIVSKNGNLLLNVPLRGDGSIDDQEVAVIEEIAAWMTVNKESIFGTRPWAILGEGPALENAAPIRAQGFNEGKGKPFTAEDIRFTSKGEAIYAIALGWPADGKLNIRSLGKNSKHLTKTIQRVDLLGKAESLTMVQNDNGLLITLPQDAPALSYANVFKIV